MSHAAGSYLLAGAEPQCPPDPGEAGVRRLVELLAGVADPRKPRGVRFTVGTVLSVMVLAVLAGAKNFREVGDRAADLPARLLELAGCALHPLTGAYVVPSEPTMRRMAHDVDADAADRRVCGWLHAQATAAAIAEGRRPGGAGGLVAVAMDGKVVRNTIAPGGAPGGEVKLFSALLHDEAITIAQLRIPEDTNEITQVQALLAEVDLTDMVVTGDAAHAQHATAAHIAVERGGHYALTVKGNQCAMWRSVVDPIQSGGI